MMEPIKRRKYQLPVYAELKHIRVDLTQLRNATDRLAHKYIDVREANPALCDNHMELVEKVYENFNQINLTVISGDTLPYTANIKERIRRKEECLYNKPTADYTNSYFESIVKQFKAPAMRVRITKLKPGKEIPFHIDYDPTYAARIIIPIYTNPLVTNEFKVRNEIKSYYLEAGKAYFLNTGFSHAVFNRSNENRIAFMFSLDGQQDLESL